MAPIFGIGETIEKVADAVVGKAEAISEYAQLRTLPHAWAGGICNCFNDPMSCLDVWCCTSCNVSRQCLAIDEEAKKQEGLDIGYCCCAFIVTYATSYGGALIAGIVRTRMLEKYNIQEEDICMSWICAICCGPCSLCQTHRTLMALGQGNKGAICKSDESLYAGAGPANPAVIFGLQGMH